MGFLWGAIMYFICHMMANIFENSIYCYFRENKCEEANKYAKKIYIKNAITSAIAYVAVIIFALNSEQLSEHTWHILIGNGIGFITGSIHFKLIADSNYLKQKEKNELESLNKMSFEERRDFLKKADSMNVASKYREAPAAYVSKATIDHTANEVFKEISVDSPDYTRRIVAYFEGEQYKAEVENIPNGEKIITVNYQNKYLWTVCIKIDEYKKTMKIYIPFFKVAVLEENDIYEIVNDLNCESLYIRFFLESTFFGPCIIAECEVPLVGKRSVGKFAFDIAEILVKTVDDQFGKMPERFDRSIM